MSRRPAAIAACLLFLASVAARPVGGVPRVDVPPAADVVKAAVARAAVEGKTVLIEFGAS